MGLFIGLRHYSKKKGLTKSVKPFAMMLFIFSEIKSYYVQYEFYNITVIIECGSSSSEVQTSLCLTTAGRV